MAMPQARKCEKCKRPSECLVLAVAPKADHTVRVCPACWADCLVQDYRWMGQIDVTAGAR